MTGIELKYKFKEIPYFLSDQPEGRALYFQEKGLGWSSLINDLVYNPGDKPNYYRYSHNLDDSPWNYKQMLP